VSYLQIKQDNSHLRLPLEGKLDLTYRCNNNCRHCWLRILLDSFEKEKELAFDEVRNVVDSACRQYII